MSAGGFCPSCGVAVVPGYVRCPKCHKPLPRRATQPVVGGTAVETRSRGALYGMIAAAVLGFAIIVIVGVRMSKAKPKPAIPAQTTTAPAPAEAPEVVAAPETGPTPTQTQATPDPNAVAGNLERQLRRLRLWSTVTVEGTRADVRSGSCAEPQMGPVLDTSVASFKAAGLTKLRCLEQSGRVVIDRDL